MSLRNQAQQYAAGFQSTGQALPERADGNGGVTAGLGTSNEETSYFWDVKSGSIQWQNNARDVLHLKGGECIANAEEFHSIIVPEHVSRRQRLIEDVRLKQKSDEGDGANGISFRVHYRIKTGARGDLQEFWFEEHGRWWPASGEQGEQVRGVVRVINEQYWEEQRLLYHADNDELTGQLNRVRLTEAVSATIARAERTNIPFAFLIVCVDNLNAINDSLGFDVGDEVISTIARTVKGKLRGGDSIGRFSSNKFGVILNDCQPGAMRIAAERLIKGVRDAPVRTSSCHHVSASISIGGVVLPEQASTVHHAFSHALQALDRAKKKRANTFMAYEPSLTRETTRQRNVSIVDDVVSALDDDRMRLVLQPLVNAQTGEHKIYECLLRMDTLNGEVVSAGEFITVAEQFGLARLIDLRTLDLAFGLLSKHPKLELSLNVSSLTAHDRDWMLRLHELTENQRDFAKRLIIEITETAAIHDIDQTVAFVDTLKEMGCRVAIDDFGAGYTSFKNLKHLSADIVKIDGAFVKNIIADKSDLVFIKTMIGLAEEFEMETVAEWVGDEETAQMLRDAGITYLQGFLYGMPMTTDEYAQLT
ncbi:MAG: putative bifunctional diguanylate cyclase/phosphodiesterase [Hyphomicrobiaceae bacterium]